MWKLGGGWEEDGRAVEVEKRRDEAGWWRGGEAAKEQLQEGEEGTTKTRWRRK